MLTPSGEIALSKIRAGDTVITLNKRAERVAATVLVVARTPVLTPHEMVVLRLGGGRTLIGSSLHPVGDGRTLGELRSGDVIERSLVLSTDRAPYRAAATWDLLPAGDTGIYFVAGVPLRSTLTVP